MENTDYHTATLVERMTEAHDVTTCVFAMDDREEFPFLPGQFNMIGFPGVEEAPVTMSSLPAPGNSLFAHTIRAVGNVTTRATSLAIGKKVMVRGPFGREWPLDKTEGRDVLIVGGGIGLAPLRPLILHCLGHREKMNRLVLVYGARTEADMIFGKDLALWQEEPAVETFFCADRVANPKSRPFEIREGLVPEFLEGLNLDTGNTAVFVCGPEIMMRFVSRSLLQKGYPGSRIYLNMERRMRCGTGHCGHCQIGAKFVCLDGPVFSHDEISRFADVLL